MLLVWCKMLLKKIKLENIRSYRNQEIGFPEGSIMLSGNIGSGKSTILLATEFALFGITNEISGGLLLRNGKDKGSVELDFEIGGKKVKIKRNLKRTNTSVLQDTGYAIIDGRKHELAAVELKQKILGLLNYPFELLKKSKSLIYRYTVYTPQETMKEILLGKKENRLEILRRVFGIDKYKRIRDNTEIFVMKIKQKTRELAVLSSDFYEKEKELKEKKGKENELRKSLSEIVPKVDVLKKNVTEKKELIGETEKKIKEYQEVKQEIEKIKISLEHKINESKGKKESLEKIEREVINLEEEVKKLPMKKENIDEIITKLNDEIKFIETRILGFQKEISSLDAKKSHHEAISRDIGLISKCPVCKQDVKENHKKSVIEKANKEVGLIEKKQNEIKTKEKNSNENLVVKRKDFEKLQDGKSKQGFGDLKRDNLKSKIQESLDLRKFLDEIKKEVSDLNSMKLNFEDKIKLKSDSEEELLSGKKDLEVLENKLKDFEIRKASVETEVSSISSMIVNLEKEVGVKRNASDNITKLKGLQDWLEKQFFNLMLVIEKKIMLQVHYELETLLQKWFTILVDSEIINIRLDEEFTPVIEQNGHEIDYTYLSGGEKTAAALSYRLALNQVINSLMTTINTKDLLILDEPTDGFSDEQLDRMRNILEELNTKQTILVSHDNKIESFVDSVIRLNKIEHVTSVV